MTEQQPELETVDDSTQLRLKAFAKPIPKEDVLYVLASWRFGDSKEFIAEACKMSVKKVTAIIRAGELIPKGWRDQASKRKKDGNEMHNLISH